MSKDERLTPGSVFAQRFRVARLVGEGEMGTTYVADPLTGGDPCALKVMHRELVENASLADKFSAATLEGQVPHANVAALLDAGFDAESGRAWLTTELLVGEELSARVRRDGALTLAHARLLVRELADALGAAHAAGVVHYDLTPENVYLASDAPFAVKLRELGLSRVVSDTFAAKDELIGTPIWMAPEQLELGSALSPAANVWTLGLIAFYALTGRSYWKGATEDGPPPRALLREIVVEALPSASVQAAVFGCEDGIPAWFDAWFARCVARAPAERFADAGLAGVAFMVAAPEAVSVVGEASAPTSQEVAAPTRNSARPRRSVPPSAIAAAIEEALATSSVNATSLSPSASTPTPTATAMSTANATTNPIATTMPASSPISSSNETPTPPPTTASSPMATAARAQPAPDPSPPRRPRTATFRVFVLAAAVAAGGIYFWDAQRGESSIADDRSTSSTSAVANAPPSKDTPAISPPKTMTLAPNVAPIVAPIVNVTGPVVPSPADTEAIANHSADARAPAPPVTGELPPAPYDLDVALKSLNSVYYGDCPVPRAGQVMITFAPTGRVSAVESTQGDFDDATKGCLAARFRSARIPPFAGKAHVVTASVIPTK